MPKSNKEPVVLPTAPRAARGPGFEEENIPNSPPYVAYISNLPYDVVDEDLEELFQEMMVIIFYLFKQYFKIKINKWQFYFTSNNIFYIKILYKK